MRLRAILVGATVSALLAGACGSAFTAATDGGSGSAGSAGSAGEGNAGSPNGGDVSTAGSSQAGASGDATAGSAGMSEGGKSGSAGSASGGSSGTAGTGGSATCADPAADCPTPLTSCVVATCKVKRCGVSAAAAGTACSDHSGHVCDGTGKCVPCLKPADCPAQTTTCKVNACDTATNTCSTTKATLGTACKDNGGAVCDGSGACVSTHCADGVQDADETDVDCGGSCGATCKEASPQQKCKIPGDCVSGSCASNLCQPSCLTTCTGSCQSCAIPGKVGACTAYPPGVDDAKNFCFMQAVCDAGPACVAAGGKGHFGDACAQDSDCFNGSCGAGLCRLKTGDACGEDAACKTGRCAAHVCSACTLATDCASGMCNTVAGTCLLPGGYLCAGNADCVTAQCVGKVCASSGAQCTTEGCPTHFCKNNLCQTCNGPSDCPLGSACTGGSCLSPPGAFCTKAASCASGTCTAGDLLTMPKCK